MTIAGCVMERISRASVATECFLATLYAMTLAMSAMARTAPARGVMESLSAI